MPDLCFSKPETRRHLSFDSVAGNENQRKTAPVLVLQWGLEHNKRTTVVRRCLLRLPRQPRAAFQTDTETPYTNPLQLATRNPQVVVTVRHCNTIATAQLSFEPTVRLASTRSRWDS
mmetsp:Transcript_33784/g.87820  ORF Transcript_33784/g.87820 Transcript_33784/m.87820 type:complete len:117 (+) Transcript_33784:870-1220(+)